MKCFRELAEKDAEKIRTKEQVPVLRTLPGRHSYHVASGAGTHLI